MSFGQHGSVMNHIHLGALWSQLGKKLSEANARIEKVRSEALAEVGTIAEDTAAQIVTHLIGGRVAKGDVEAAVSTAKEG